MALWFHRHLNGAFFNPEVSRQLDAGKVPPGLRFWGTLTDHKVLGSVLRQDATPVRIEETSTEYVRHSDSEKPFSENSSAAHAQSFQNSTTMMTWLKTALTSNRTLLNFRLPGSTLMPSLNNASNSALSALSRQVFNTECNGNASSRQDQEGQQLKPPRMSDYYPASQTLYPDRSIPVKQFPQTVRGVPLPSYIGRVLEQEATGKGYLSPYWLHENQFWVADITTANVRAKESKVFSPLGIVVAGEKFFNSEALDAVHPHASKRVELYASYRELRYKNLWPCDHRGSPLPMRLAFELLLKHAEERLYVTPSTVWVTDDQLRLMKDPVVLFSTTVPSSSLRSAIAYHNVLPQIPPPSQVVGKDTSSETVLPLVSPNDQKGLKQNGRFEPSSTFSWSDCKDWITGRLRSMGSSSASLREEENHSLEKPPMEALKANGPLLSDATKMHSPSVNHNPYAKVEKNQTRRKRKGVGKKQGSVAARELTRLCQEVRGLIAKLDQRVAPPPAEGTNGMMVADATTAVGVKAISPSVNDIGQEVQGETSISQDPRGAPQSEAANAGVIGTTSVAVVPGTASLNSTTASKASNTAAAAAAATPGGTGAERIPNPTEPNGFYRSIRNEVLSDAIVKLILKERVVHTARPHDRYWLTPTEGKICGTELLPIDKRTKGVWIGSTLGSAEQGVKERSRQQTADEYLHPASNFWHPDLCLPAIYKRRLESPQLRLQCPTVPLPPPATGKMTKVEKAALQQYSSSLEFAWTVKRGMGLGSAPDRWGFTIESPGLIIRASPIPEMIGHQVTRVNGIAVPTFEAFKEQLRRSAGMKDGADKSDPNSVRIHTLVPYPCQADGVRFSPGGLGLRLRGIAMAMGFRSPTWHSLHHVQDEKLQLRPDAVPVPANLVGRPRFMFIYNAEDILPTQPAVAKAESPDVIPTVVTSAATNVTMGEPPASPPAAPATIVEPHKQQPIVSSRQTETAMPIHTIPPTDWAKLKNYEASRRWRRATQAAQQRQNDENDRQLAKLMRSSPSASGETVSKIVGEEPPTPQPQQAVSLPTPVPSDLDASNVHANVHDSTPRSAVDTSQGSTRAELTRGQARLLAPAQAGKGKEDDKIVQADSIQPKEDYSNIRIVSVTRASETDRFGIIIHKNVIIKDNAPLARFRPGTRILLVNSEPVTEDNAVEKVLSAKGLQIVFGVTRHSLTIHGVSRLTGIPNTANSPNSTATPGSSRCTVAPLSPSQELAEVLLRKETSLSLKTSYWVTLEAAQFARRVPRSTTPIECPVFVEGGKLYPCSVKDCRQSEVFVEGGKLYPCSVKDCRQSEEDGSLRTFSIFHVASFEADPRPAPAIEVSSKVDNGF